MPNFPTVQAVAKDLINDFCLTSNRNTFIRYAFPKHNLSIFALKIIWEVLQHVQEPVK